MRREERVTVQGRVKKQQPDGMSHMGGGGGRGSPHLDPPVKRLGEISSRPPANQTFSLAPSAQITLDTNFSSALLVPLKPQHQRGRGGRWTPPPPKQPGGPSHSSLMQAPPLHSRIWMLHSVGV